MSEDKAITTGAPVATNDAQAAELTQRFKVGDRVQWKSCNDRCGSVRKILSGEYLTVAWDGAIDAIEHAGSLELAPTPRPTPGGELLAGIRKDIDAICNIYRTVGDAMSDEPRERLALRVHERVLDRLNAADAMEKALKEICDETDDDVALKIATAALRGGA